jgi:uncharacterized protein YcsI (UPF0317 family)
VGTQFESKVIPSGIKYNINMIIPHAPIITAIFFIVNFSFNFKMMLIKTKLNAKEMAIKKADKMYKILSSNSLLVGVNSTNTMFNIRPIAKIK